MTMRSSAPSLRLPRVPAMGSTPSPHSFLSRPLLPRSQPWKAPRRSCRQLTSSLLLVLNHTFQSFIGHPPSPIASVSSINMRPAHDSSVTPPPFSLPALLTKEHSHPNRVQCLVFRRHHYPTGLFILLVPSITSSRLLHPSSTFSLSRPTLPSPEARHSTAILHDAVPDPRGSRFSSQCPRSGRCRSRDLDHHGRERYCPIQT